MGPERVSTHSMRAGCATALYANGVDPSDLQRWGRWKSPVYMRYVAWKCQSAYFESCDRASNQLDGPPFSTRAKETKVNSPRVIQMWRASKNPAEATRSPEGENHTCSDVTNRFDGEMMEIMEDRRLNGGENRKYERVKTETKRILQRKRDEVGEEKTDVWTPPDERRVAEDAKSSSKEDGV